MMSVRPNVADSKVNLHNSGSEDWSLSEHTLEVLRALLKPGMRTVETGAGHSTLEFARAGCVHTAITPSADEVDRIRAAAQARGVSMDVVDFKVAPSEIGFPSVPGPIDLALVDGGHGFPIPHVDFFHAASKLAVGGVLVLDDVQLWSVRTIKEFLLDEPDWQHLCTVEGKTSFFRLQRPYVYREWRSQPQIERKSRIPMFLNYGRRAAAHIRRGDYARLGRAIAKFVRRQVHPAR